MNFQFIPVAEASITTLMQKIDKVIINPLIILMFALAMVYFIYGLIKYLLSPDNEEVRKSSKSHMLWGVIGMFVMISVFGFMNLILTTLKESRIQIQSNGDYTIGNLGN